MQQPPHLPPNPGQFPPVGLPHLPAAKLPPPPQGLPGLPVALGGTANVTRPNGLHPSMMLPTPPPLVSVPHTSVPPGAGGPPLIVPPHRPAHPPLTSAPLVPPPPMAPNTRPTTLPPATGSSPLLSRSVPATLDTSTRPTPSAAALPTPSTDNSSSTNNASQGLTRPRSPGAERQSESPSAKRARSRSPLQVADDSDSDSEPPRSPEPEATILDMECHRSKHAIFLRHLSRGWNSCSRCDIQFRPTSDSAASRSREEKVKAISQQQQQQQQSSVKEPVRPEERRERREDEPKPAMNGSGTPPTTTTSKPSDPPGFLPPSSAAAHLSSPYGRLSPGRPPYPPLGGGVQDPTPALRQLSEYARPHVLGGDPQRNLPPYTMGTMPNHPLMAADPYYRMAAMYPPGSRERLELELDREKRERDARERELREKELRDMEMREKMKQEMEMKPPAGFERILPPGANPMDPYWTELLKRYAAIPPSGGAPPPPGAPPPGAPPGAPPAPPPGVSGPVAHHPSQLPGIYSPAHLNSDLIRAERERMERLGEAARAAGNDPLASANLAFYEYYQRVSYEQIVLHRQALAQATGGSKPPPEAASADPRLAEYARLAQHFARADPLSAGSGSGAQPPPGGLPAGYPPIPPAHSLPPGHPLLEAARQQELLYRDLLSRSPYGAAAADPVLAQHLQISAQQEAAARIALERERLAAHGAGSRPPSHLH